MCKIGFGRGTKCSAPLVVRCIWLCKHADCKRFCLCGKQRQCHCLALFQDEARALLNKVASLCAPGSDVLITFIGKVDASKHGMCTQLMSLLWGLLPNLSCGSCIQINMTLLKLAFQASGVYECVCVWS